MVITDKEDKIQVYELSYHFVPSIPAEKVGEKRDWVIKQITERGAEITKEEQPTLIDLAYTMIKKIGTTNHRFNEAYFGWVKFTMASTQAESLIKVLEKEVELLRYLFISTVAEDTYLGKRARSRSENEEMSEESGEVAKATDPAEEVDSKDTPKIQAKTKDGIEENKA